MSLSEIQGRTVNVKLWTPLEEVESQALDQLRNIASLPWVFHHVAAMPDVHLGVGATVGSVIAMKDAVTPAAVGVDIGCGMAAVLTSLSAKDLPDNLKTIRSRIEESIPVGTEVHDRTFSCHNLNLMNRIKAHFNHFKNLDAGAQEHDTRAIKQIGTLGGGNHFIELCLDTDNRVWMMLHSGSRYIGNILARIHMAKASYLTHNNNLPDPDLASFLAGTPEMDAYRRDLYWAQEYAFLNREAMLELYKTVLKEFFPKVSFSAPILCHHNYVAEEMHYGEKVFVTRKGAINAEKGVMAIIPGSMGTASYIVRGLGNPESFNSASHGAGRAMSRGQAKRTFNLEDFEKQTAGVECRKDSSVLDEIPGAYKDIDKVMENQKDLVEIVTKLKQVLCVKG